MQTGKGAGGEFADTLKESRARSGTLHGYRVADGVPVLRDVATLARQARGHDQGRWRRCGCVSEWKVGGASRTRSATKVRSLRRRDRGDLPPFAKLFDIASQLPFVGKKFGRLADKANKLADRVDKAGEKTKDLGYEIKKLPKIEADQHQGRRVGRCDQVRRLQSVDRGRRRPGCWRPGSISDQIGGEVAGRWTGRS